VEAAMGEAGVSVATMRRAKQEIGVVARRTTGPKVTWVVALPEAGTGRLIVGDDG